MILSALGAEAAPQSAPSPDADFLEFLGSWSTEDARPRWIDPFQMREFPIDETVNPAPAARSESRDRLSKPQTDRPSSQRSPDPSRTGEGAKP